MPTRGSGLNVVLFSGGRGSSVLSRQLVNHPDLTLTVAINGYDDGASTGEVRRFLGDSLGPSDFRKNASRLARELGSCPDALVALLDERLPAVCTREEAIQTFDRVGATPRAGRPGEIGHLADQLPPGLRGALAGRLDRFRNELEGTGRPFEFSDCALGNIVFAGCFLARARRFNDALDDYCALLSLAPGLIDNVTDGTNAFLVALDVDHRFLGSEAEVVDAKRRNRIQDIFLLGERLTDAERHALERYQPDQAVQWLQRRELNIPLNPRVRARLEAADLIIYSPGTQHSSLFPSYLTAGLSLTVAANLTALKLLVTNIQSDAEIAGSSAVDIIDRAVYYLQEKGRLSLPVPSLITHYIINDPASATAPAPYVAPGRLDLLEDPRLVRVGDFEDGLTGRHDAVKVLGPFLDVFLPQKRQRVAVWLYDAGSLNKLVQSILEILRGGLQRLPVDVTMCYAHSQHLDEGFVASLPFTVRRLADGGQSPGAGFSEIARREGFDYAVLFESSGMYRGEDVVGLLSPLTAGRIDAVWGSRRLSMKEIEASYRLRYRRNVVLGALSYVGSHLLSLAYLMFYGRYVSDTLSGARAIRARFLADVPLDHKLSNQYLLSAILREKADLIETPVHFLPISPDRVRRTSVREGLWSLGAIAWRRLAPPPDRVVPPTPADLKASRGANSEAPAARARRWR